MQGARRDHVHSVGWGGAACAKAEPCRGHTPRPLGGAAEPSSGMMGSAAGCSRPARMRRQRKP